MGNGDKKRCIGIAPGVYVLADKYKITLINTLMVAHVYDNLTKSKDENNSLLKVTIAAYYESPATNVDDDMGKMLTSIVLGPRTAILTSPAMMDMMREYPMFDADQALAMRSGSLCFLHRQTCFACSKAMYVDRASVHAHLRKNLTTYCTWCGKSINMENW